MRTIQIPDSFCFSLEQVAEMVGCSVQTLREHTKKDPESRFYLRSRSNTSGGKVVVQYADLEEYINRTASDYQRQLA